MVESKAPDPRPTFTASQLITYINIKLALLGYPPVAGADGVKAPDIVAAFAAQFQEKDRLLGQYLCTADQRIVQMYFADGSIAQACPPLRALLHIMLDDTWEGKGLNHPDVRKLFTREAMMTSDWYALWLQAKQTVDQALWRRHTEYLDKFLKRASHADEAQWLGIAGRLMDARQRLAEVDAANYWQTLSGTLGAEPIEAYSRAG